MLDNFEIEHTILNDHGKNMNYPDPLSLFLDLVCIIWWGYFRVLGLRGLCVNCGAFGVLIGSVLLSSSTSKSKIMKDYYYKLQINFILVNLFKWTDATYDRKLLWILINCIHPGYN